jgi:hypothetical protein
MKRNVAEIFERKCIARWRDASSNADPSALIINSPLQSRLMFGALVL